MLDPKPHSTMTSRYRLSTPMMAKRYHLFTHCRRQCYHWPHTPTSEIRSNRAISHPSFHSPNTLQLNLIRNLNLLPRLESRLPNIRAPITPKRISQGAIPTAAHFPLDGEIDLGEFVGLELRELLVGCAAFGCVFGFEALGETAGAVFAGAAALAGFGAAFDGCWIAVSGLRLRFRGGGGMLTLDDG